MDEMDSGLVNILLVEDNPDDERLIREMLAVGRKPRIPSRVRGPRWKSQRLLWCNGTSAAILLDLSLPDSQGLEAIRWVRTTAKGRPIVVLSGTDDEELAMQAVKGGRPGLSGEGRPYAQNAFPVPGLCHREKPLT